MKRIVCFAFVCAVSTTLVFSQEKGQDKSAKKPAAPAQPAAEPKSAELKSTRDQASYAIGLNIARNMKKDGLDISSAALIQGLLDVFNNVPPKMSNEQCQAALDALDREMQQKIVASGDKNKKDGEAFLVANKQKQGVVTLPSGLQYQVIKAGNGPSPKLNDTVKTHYHGTLINGTVFDSSVERNEPAEFPVNGVIRGWTEALQKMKVGDKWRLFVPPDLAYGRDGAPPAIGPNTVLVFEVELLAIQPPR